MVLLSALNNSDKKTKTKFKSLFTESICTYILFFDNIKFLLYAFYLYNRILIFGKLFYLLVPSLYCNSLLDNLFEFTLNVRQRIIIQIPSV